MNPARQEHSITGGADICLVIALVTKDTNSQLPTPNDDPTHPTDWHDVLSTVLSEIEARQRGFWIE